jgi:hypothetical protein
MKMTVFLSYAYSDRLAAEALARQLAKANIRVWDPYRDLSPGENPSLRTGEELDKADALVVLFSPSTAKSPWIQREVEYALTTPRFEGRLIAVEVRPTRSMPWILRKLQAIRFYEDPPKATESLVRRIKELAKAPANAS